MEWAPIFDVISWICITVGALTALTGALGILRLPDVFSRMHGAGMIDTMGMGLILIGLMFQADQWTVVVKLGLIIAFILLTSPTTTFALARAAIDAGQDPGPRDPLPKQPPRAPSAEDKPASTAPQNAKGSQGPKDTKDTQAAKTEETGS